MIQDVSKWREHIMGCPLPDNYPVAPLPEPILPESRGTTAQELHRMHTEAEDLCPGCNDTPHPNVPCSEARALRAPLNAMENTNPAPPDVVTSANAVLNSLPYTFALDPAEACLRKALDVVTGARRKAYGTPEQNFERISYLWQAHMAQKTTDRGTITPTDVAIMMILMKVARLQETPDHGDSWVDIAGYAACGVRTSGATV